MDYPVFHRNLGPFTLRQIADHINADLTCNDENFLIKNFSGIESANSTDITFIIDSNDSHIESMEVMNFIVSKKNKRISSNNKNILKVDNLHLAVAKLSNFFYKSHDSNFINSLNPPNLDNCKYLDEKAVISNGVIIGKNLSISSGAYIGHNCVIGENVTIENNTVITNSIIGDNVNIGRNCSIGQPGFGFAINSPVNSNIFHKCRVVLQNNVKIGSNCCIDRGSFRDTVIGENTYMDNMCHIAHNVVIGNNCVFAACLGIAGSANIGNFVFTGGQVGINGHVKVGDRVKIAAQSGVFYDVESDENLMGSPAINRFKYLKNFKKNNV